MPADGGIGADGDGAKGVMGGVVERLAHAVQALEFDPHFPLGRHAVDGGQGVGVVGGELAVDVRRGLDHRLGADEVVEVGRSLGGEDRIVGAAEDLGAFDLGVPIGTLDQTDHQTTTGGLRQFGNAANHLGAALLIGLDGEAEAGPAAQFGFMRQPVEQLQRQGQTVRLFGVHGEIDVVLRRDPGQTQDAGIELVPDAGLLRGLIAGRQGRQLDGNAVTGLGALPFRRLADGGDGVGVDLFIALGVMGGAGTLAQHVETAQPALAVGALQRRLDGAADHELFAHDAHGGGDGLADDRLAQTADDSLEEAGQVGAGLLVHIDQLARQHQAPGRGVDEQAVGLAEVGRPVGRADLFCDQTVAGLFIGRAQQGLGQAHQGQALAGAERELLQEAFDHALFLDAGAGPFDQADGLAEDGSAPVPVQRHAIQQTPDRGGLIRELALVQRIPILGQGDGRRDVCVHGARLRRFRRGTGEGCNVSPIAIRGARGCDRSTAEPPGPHANRSGH